MGPPDQLANQGLTIGGYVQLDTSKTLSGGLDTDSIPTRYLLDLNITYAPPSLPNTSFFLDFESHDGPNASTTSVGDIQGFDNLDALHLHPNLPCFWYQQYLFNRSLRLKLGKIDANNDFSVIEHGQQFLHSAAASALSNTPMVTYPDPAPDARTLLHPPTHLYAGGSAFYSNSHQTFLDFAGHPEKIELTDGGTSSSPKPATTGPSTPTTKDSPATPPSARTVPHRPIQRPVLNQPPIPLRAPPRRRGTALLDQSLYTAPATRFITNPVTEE